jgi:MFS family permease
VEGLPLKQVLGNNKVEVVVSMLLTWLLSAAIVVVILMTPTYLQKQLGIAPAMALQANSLAIVALTVGCIFFGWLNDRFSSGLIFIAGSIGLGGAAYAFYHGVVADQSLLLSRMFEIVCSYKEKKCHTLTTKERIFAPHLRSKNSITLTKVLLAASQMLNTNNPMEHGKVPVRDG